MPATVLETLAPGVRLGWLVLPAYLVEDVVAAKASADRHTGVALLAERAPGVRVTGVAAGMDAVLELPPRCDEGRRHRARPNAGLALDGLGMFGTRGHRRAPALVIGYGTPPAHAFTAAPRPAGRYPGGPPLTGQHLRSYVGRSA